MGRTIQHEATPVVLRILVGILCLILIAPIVIVVVVSFSGSGYLRFPPHSLSLQWYTKFFHSTAWQQSVETSLLVGLVACVLASIIGFLGAYAFVRGRFRRRKFLLSLVLLPMIVPPIITSIALYYVSSPLGLVGNRLWIGVCHSVIALPIVVLLLISSLQAVDPALERAAQSLGANPFTVMRRIVIPLALPGVLSAALFAFLASFDELIIALFLSGISAETLPVRIWNSLRLQVEPTIAAVSSVFIGATLAVLLVDWAARRSNENAATRTRSR